MVPRVLGEVTKFADVAGTEQLVTNKVYASAAVTKDEAKAIPKIATVMVPS